MADTTTDTATATEDAATATTDTTTDTTEDKGKGSKDAVLADLAKERDKRQELEQQFTDFRTALAGALGLNKDEAPDPAALAAQLAEKDDQIRTLSARETIRTIGKDAGADTEALLDSATFLNTLGNLDLTNAAAVTDHVKSFVEAHPRYAAVKVTPGVRDAAAGGDTSTNSVDVNELIRRAAGR